MPVPVPVNGRYRARRAGPPQARSGRRPSTGRDAAIPASRAAGDAAPVLSTIPTSPAALTRPSARTVTEPVAPGQDGPLSVDALRHPVHLAVVAGADAGACLPVTATPVSVGRATAPGTRAGSSAHTRPEHAPLDDPLLSRRHLEVRAAAGGAVVRDAGSTNGSRVCVPRRPGRDGRPRWRRARRLGRRRQFVPFGARIHAGGTVLEVRPRPGADPATGEAPAEAESPTRRRTSTAPPRRRGVDTAMRVVPSLLLLVILVPMLAASGDGCRHSAHHRPGTPGANTGAGAGPPSRGPASPRCRRARSGTAGALR